MLEGAGRLRIQPDVTNCANTGYENIPRDADHRNDLGEHGYSIAKGKAHGK